MLILNKYGYRHIYCLLYDNICHARDTQTEKKPNQCVMKLPKKYKIMLVTLILPFVVSRVNIARFPADLLLKLCSAPSFVLSFCDLYYGITTGFFNAHARRD